MCAEAAKAGPEFQVLAEDGSGGERTHKDQVGRLNGWGGLGSPGELQFGKPRSEAVYPGGNRSTIFPSWFRYLPPDTS